MHTVYAIILTYDKVVDRKVNYHRPYKIVESAKHTSKMLLTQFPDCTVVMASKRVLLDGPYDLHEFDFELPLLIPTGVAPKEAPIGIYIE